MRPLDRAMPRGMWWICLLALCVHLPMLSGAFIFDAVAAIQESACVRGHVPVIEVLGRDFWCEDVPSQIRSWRPLPVLVWRAIWRVFPETPWPFHLASLLAHVGVVPRVELQYLGQLLRDLAAQLLVGGEHVRPVLGCQPPAKLERLDVG